MLLLIMISVGVKPIYIFPPENCKMNVWAWTSIAKNLLLMEFLTEVLT